MAGDDVPYDNPALKGIGRYFNNSTIRGRANVAIATVTGMAIYLLYRIITKGKKDLPPPKAA